MNPSNSWDRRTFLKAGATTLAFGPATTSAFRTRVTDMLQIEHPILLAGMGGASGVELASAVSAAGGLGVLGCVHLPPAEVRKRIHEVRAKTNKPFGVNLLLHSQVWPPIDANTISDDVVHAVHAVLNRFRARLGLPPRGDRPQTRPNHVPEVIEVLLEERVPVFSIGLGNPPRNLVEQFHERGAKVIAMAATVEDAVALDANGVDIIIAQGHEAGGHRSTWTKRPTAQHAAIGTMTFVPQVVKAVNVPVVAAGGISEGKNLVAALALGAEGVSVGTRLVATRESLARDIYKNKLVESRGDATVVTDAFTGLFARVLRNRFTDEYDAARAPTFPGYLQGNAISDIVAKQDPEYFPMWAGQCVGLIDDIPHARDVIAAMVREAHEVLSSLDQKFGRL